MDLHPVTRRSTSAPIFDGQSFDWAEVATISRYENRVFSSAQNNRGNFQVLLTSSGMRFAQAEKRLRIGFCHRKDGYASAKRGNAGKALVSPCKLGRVFRLAHLIVPTAHLLFDRDDRGR